MTSRSLPDDGAADPRAALAAAFEDEAAALVERRRAELAVLYRMHLRHALRLASPILTGFAVAEGVVLADLVDAMTPADAWPSVGWAAPARLLTRHVAGSARGGSAARSGDVAIARRLARGGVLVRPPSHERGMFAVWAAGDCLDACFDLGMSRVLLSGSEGTLRLPPGISGTLLASLPGRRLDALISHPLLDGPAHVMRGVLSVPGRIGRPRTDAVAFSCGLEPIDLSPGER